VGARVWPQIPRSVRGKTAPEKAPKKRPLSEKLKKRKHHSGGPRIEGGILKRGKEEGVEEGQKGPKKKQQGKIITRDWCLRGAGKKTAGRNLGLWSEVLSRSSKNVELSSPSDTI